MARRATFELPWVPPAEVRGNIRLGWAQKARHVDILRTAGVDEGVLYRRAHPDEEFPIPGPLELRVEAWAPRHIDGDNLLIGYKGFLDGLGAGTWKNPGAAVIGDDHQIVSWSIRLQRRAGRSVLSLTSAESHGDNGAQDGPNYPAKYGT